MNNKEQGEKLLRVEQIPTENGGQIPISLKAAAAPGDPEKPFYTIDIDGVTWVETDNQTHGIVLFEMMKDHITEYMHYKSV